MSPTAKCRYRCYFFIRYRPVAASRRSSIVHEFISRYRYGAATRFYRTSSIDLLFHQWHGVPEVTVLLRQAFQSQQRVHVTEQRYQSGKDISVGMTHWG